MKNFGMIALTSFFALAAGAQTSVNLGATQNSGNTENTRANLGVTSTLEEGASKLDLKAEYNYGESKVVGGKKTTDTENALGAAKYSYLLADPVYGYLNADILTDDIAGVDYRLTAGPGLGTYLMKDEAAQLGVEAGLAFIRDKVRGDVAAADGTMTEVAATDDRWALRIAQNYKRKLSETANVFQSLEYLPTVDETSQFLLNAEIGVEAMMNDRLSLRLVAKNSHNSEPPAGKKDNDLSLIGGFGYKL